VTGPIARRTPVAAPDGAEAAAPGDGRQRQGRRRHQSGFGHPGAGM